MTWDYFSTKWNLHCIKMEFKKIVNLLDMTFDDKDLPRCVTKKWIEVFEVYDQSGGENYHVNKEIRNRTPMLRSDLCNFIDAYIVVKGSITVTDPDEAKRNKSVTFKNNAPLWTAFQKSMVYKLIIQKI